MTLEEKIDHLSNVLSEHIKEDSKMECKEEKKAPVTDVVGTILGGIGTAAAVGNGANNGGILGGLFGGGYNAIQQENVRLQTELAQCKADQYTDAKLVQVYSDLNAKNNERSSDIASLASRVLAIETALPLREQLVYQKIDCCCNAANTGIQQLSNSLNALSTTVANLTKIVIPAANICPEPMSRYNSWTAPTTSTTP